jgi:hypothetical protein
MRGQFSGWPHLWRWREQIGGGLGNAQHHRVAVGHEEIAHTVGARTCGEQDKAVPEERMSGIGDFDFGRVV